MHRAPMDDSTPSVHAHHVHVVHIHVHVHLYVKKYYVFQRKSGKKIEDSENYVMFLV